jgi:phenylacetate-coenzyme A ligase PaaK-like adenylate-forming protein
MFELSPFSLEKKEKEKFLLNELIKLTNFHLKHSREYYKILKAFNYLDKNYKFLADFFPLPVRLFKEYELKSTKDIVKVLTSSGTTSNRVSKIFLDKETSVFQTKALIKICLLYTSPSPRD